MSSTQVPEALLDAVKRDLNPVRPLAHPTARALMMVPVALLLLAGMPAFWFWIGAAKVAPERLWSLSLLESALSFVILTAALREAIPGQALSKGRLWGLLLIAGLSFVVANSTIQDPGTVETRTWMHWLVECTAMAIVFSIPALLLPTWLIARGLPNRPALAGALCGLSVGLMADAGVRLFCWDGGVAHLIFSHGGAILLLVAVGAGSTLLIERIKSARR